MVAGSTLLAALTTACGPAASEAGSERALLAFADVGPLSVDDPLGLPADELTAAARRASNELRAAREGSAVLPGGVTGLSTTMPARRRVVLLGSRPDLFGDDLAGALDRAVEIVRADHPSMQPFELLCWTPAVIEADPALVVISLSLRDTFGPLAVGPLPGGMPEPAFDALAAMLRPEEGAARHELQVVRSAGGEPAHQGRQVVTLDAQAAVDVDLGALLDEWERSDSSLAGTHHLARQARGMQRVVAGRHVELAHDLLTVAVERLIEAGIPVVLVEAPLHPATRQLHVRALRNEFLQALAGLLARDGVGLVMETQLGPFPSTDFVDLGTLGPRGRLRAAPTTVRRLREALDR